MANLHEPIEPPSGAAGWRASTVRALVVIVCLARIFIPATDAQEAVNSGLHVPKLGGYFDISVSSRYIYHGYVVEDRGPVVHPYLYGEAKFYSGTGWLSSAYVTLGVLNTLQFRHDGISAENEMLRTWYELQVEPGLSLVFAEALTVSANYIRFESPNGAYISGNAAALRLELDDERWLGAFALRPHFLWFMPVGNESNPDTEQGHHFELGVKPGGTIGKNSAYPVSVSLPAVLGVGDKHYYAGRHFGFVSAGVTVSMPLAFVPKGLGDWSLSGSALYYRLGSAPAEFTSGGERDKSVFTATLAAEF